MPGQPGRNTRLHSRMLHNFLGMDAWMTSQMKVALIRKVRGSLMCLAYFFLTCYPLEFQNQALADVRSTGSGIKCLYCKRYLIPQSNTSKNISFNINILNYLQFR